MVVLSDSDLTLPEQQPLLKKNLLTGLCLEKRAEGSCEKAQRPSNLNSHSMPMLAIMLSHTMS